MSTLHFHDKARKKLLDNPQRAAETERWEAEAVPASCCRPVPCPRWTFSRDFQTFYTVNAALWSFDAHRVRESRAPPRETHYTFPAKIRLVVCASARTKVFFASGFLRFVCRRMKIFSAFERCGNRLRDGFRRSCGAEFFFFLFA